MLAVYNKSMTELSTRERLLSAALDVFASHGYEGASTRLIVSKAGVNISAIPYYFSGKEGLYKATLEHIASIIRKNVASQSDIIQQANKDTSLSPEECRAVLHQVMGGMAQFFLGDIISPAIVQIFIREQVDPTPSFDDFYDGTMRPLHEMATSLIGRIAGLPCPSEEATLCAHAILGQVIVFKTHKEAALRRLGWKKYGSKEMDKIMQTVRFHTDAILDSYAAKIAKGKK